VNQKLKRGIIIGLCCTTVVMIALWILGVFNSFNPLDADVSKTVLNIKLGQLKGQDLISNQSVFESSFQDKPEVLSLLRNNYTPKESEDSLQYQIWKSFYGQEYVIGIEKEISVEFSDLKEENNKLLLSFKRLKSHFPKKKLPKEIIFTNTNFGGNVYLGNGKLIVGLERYLGGYKKEVEKILPPSEFPLWMQMGFDQQFMHRDIIMSSILSNHTIPESSSEYLIEKIIEWGKVCVVTEMALRINNEDIPAEIVLRWSKDQWSWAEKNEKVFWNHLSKNDMLFSRSEKTNAFFLNNGPYTIGFSEKSPDRMGQYLGWKMVRNYIFNEKLSLSEMVRLDYKKILKAYNP
tara:strand:+ start:230 stop:1273 length:1044 start_codon:yes stop_codon:yes gene_type:complete